MGAVAAPLAIGLSAAGSVAQGFGTQAADDYQSSRLEQAAEYGKAAAAQTAAQGTEKLALKLDNIDAVRAAANADPSSPTTAAIRSRTSYLMGRETDIQVENIMAQVAQEQSDANYMHSAGNFALGMGFLSGAAGVVKGIGSTNWGTFGLGGVSSNPLLAGMPTDI